MDSSSGLNALLGAGAPNFLTAQCSRMDVTPELRIGVSGGLKPFQNEPDHRSVPSNKSTPR